MSQSENPQENPKNIRENNEEPKKSEKIPKVTDFVGPIESTRASTQKTLEPKTSFSPLHEYKLPEYRPFRFRGISEENLEKAKAHDEEFQEIIASALKGTRKKERKKLEIIENKKEVIFSKLKTIFAILEHKKLQSHPHVKSILEYLGFSSTQTIENDNLFDGILYPLEHYLHEASKLQKDSLFVSPLSKVGSFNVEDLTEEALKSPDIKSMFEKNIRNYFSSIPPYTRENIKEQQNLLDAFISQKPAELSVNSTIHIHALFHIFVKRLKHAFSNLPSDSKKRDKQLQKIAGLLHSDYNNPLTQKQCFELFEYLITGSQAVSEGKSFLPDSENLKKRLEAKIQTSHPFYEEIQNIESPVKNVNPLRKLAPFVSTGHQFMLHQQYKLFYELGEKNALSSIFTAINTVLQQDNASEALEQIQALIEMVENESPIELLKKNPEKVAYIAWGILQYTNTIFQEPQILQIAEENNKHDLQEIIQSVYTLDSQAKEATSHFEKNVNASETLETFLKKTKEAYPNLPQTTYAKISSLFQTFIEFQENTSEAIQKTKKPESLDEYKKAFIQAATTIRETIQNSEKLIQGIYNLLETHSENIALFLTSQIRYYLPTTENQYFIQKKTDEFRDSLNQSIQESLKNLPEEVLKHKGKIQTYSYILASPNITSADFLTTIGAQETSLNSYFEKLKTQHNTHQREIEAIEKKIYEEYEKYLNYLNSQILEFGQVLQQQRVPNCEEIIQRYKHITAKIEGIQNQTALVELDVEYSKKLYEKILQEQQNILSIPHTTKADIEKNSGNFSSIETILKNTQHDLTTFQLYIEILQENNNIVFPLAEMLQKIRRAIFLFEVEKEIEMPFSSPEKILPHIFEILKSTARYTQPSFQTSQHSNIFESEKNIANMANALAVLTELYDLFTAPTPNELPLKYPFPNTIQKTYAAHYQKANNEKVGSLNATDTLWNPDDQLRITETIHQEWESLQEIANTRDIHTHVEPFAITPQLILENAKTVLEYMRSHYKKDLLYKTTDGKIAELDEDALVKHFEQKILKIVQQKLNNLYTETKSTEKDEHNLLELGQSDELVKTTKSIAKKVYSLTELKNRFSQKDIAHTIPREVLLETIEFISYFLQATEKAEIERRSSILFPELVTPDTVKDKNILLFNASEENEEHIKNSQIHIRQTLLCFEELHTKLFTIFEKYNIKLLKRLEHIEDPIQSSILSLWKNHFGPLCTTYSSERIETEHNEWEYCGQLLHAHSEYFQQVIRKLKVPYPNTNILIAENNDYSTSFQEAETAIIKKLESMNPLFSFMIQVVSKKETREEKLQAAKEFTQDISGFLLYFLKHTISELPEEGLNEKEHIVKLIELKHKIENLKTEVIDKCNYENIQRIVKQQRTRGIQESYLENGEIAPNIEELTTQLTELQKSLQRSFTEPQFNTDKTALAGYMSTQLPLYSESGVIAPKDEITKKMEKQHIDTEIIPLEITPQSAWNKTSFQINVIGHELLKAYFTRLQNVYYKNESAETNINKDFEVVEAMNSTYQETLHNFMNAIPLFPEGKSENLIQHTAFTYLLSNFLQYLQQEIKAVENASLQEKQEVFEKVKRYVLTPSQNSTLWLETINVLFPHDFPEVIPEVENEQLSKKLITEYKKSNRSLIYPPRTLWKK